MGAQQVPKITVNYFYELHTIAIILKRHSDILNLNCLFFIMVTQGSVWSMSQCLYTKNFKKKKLAKHHPQE